MAFAHVDDPVRHFGVEADEDALPGLKHLERRAAAATRRRQVRQANFRSQSVLGKRRLNAGNQIAAIDFIVGVLELTSAAFREVAARRLLVVRPKGERAVIEDGIAGYAEGHMPPAWRHAVTARGNPDD
jgi:hypothetical protein